MLLNSIKDGDWTGVRKNFQKLGSLYLGERSSQTFAELTLTGLTASQLLQTDADKKLTSIALPLTVAKGGTGAITLTDHSILLGSGTSAITALGAATDGQLPIGSTGVDPVLAAITGTSDQITVTNAAGSITLSLPQDYDTGATPTLGQLTLSTTCTLAAGLNVLRVTGLQTDGTAMTGTLRGAYIDVSNGSTAATGTIRGMELKARTEAPGDTGNDVTVLEGLSISADSKDHSVTTMRAAEFILDGSTGGTITEAVGLRIANNLQANKATTSYGLQIYRDSFDYTADIQLSDGSVINKSGNWGIGTATPDEKVAINGNLKFLTSDFFIKDSAGNNRFYAGDNSYVDAKADGQIRFLIGGHQKAVIDKNGNIGWGTGPETFVEWMSTAPYLTIHNSTHEDTDGGRESRLIFKGEQSGGEETELAQIEVSHDGSSDDQLGKMVYSVNTGAGIAEGLRINSNADVDIVNDLTAGTIQADNGYTGSWTNAESNTVTVVGGVITDVS